jgi:CBS domain containing-hemolysin-like protein
VLALIIANGLFVAGEFSLVAVDRSRLAVEAERGSRRARIALHLTGRLAFQLSGTQLGVTMTALVLGLLAEPIVGRSLRGPVRSLVGAHSATTVAAVVAIAAVTVTQMVIAELVPKNLAVARAYRVATTLGPFLRAYSFVFGPVIRVLSGAANATVRRLGIEPAEELDAAPTASELAAVIRTSEAEGAIGATAGRLLQRSLRFADKSAADALTPRLALETIDAAASVADLVATVRASGYSRLPVIEGDVDHVVGVVLAKDVFTVAPAERSTTAVGAVMSPVLAVPATKDLDSLLVEMRSSGRQMAIVVDEFGSTTGVLTLEDILEELVGAIEDEHDEQPRLTAVPRGSVRLDGTARPDDVFEACGLEIPDGEYETLAGFVLARFDRIPIEGDEVVWNGWRFTVEAMDRRRIARVLVQPEEAS